MNSPESDSAPSVRVCVVYYSNFKGATRALAEAVADGVREVEGSTVTLLHVDELSDDWQELHAADAMIFGSPTYVGSVSAGFKYFIERCAGDIWLDRKWLNKIASGFTVSAGRSGDKLNCLQDLTLFAAQMGMIWVPVRITGGNYSSAGSEEDLNRMAGYLGVMAQANIDEGPELAPPASDIATARMHGAHVATVALQFKYGRQRMPADYDAFALEAPSGSPRGLAEL